MGYSEEGVVIVAALHENRVVPALADFFQELRFFFGTVPDKAEVAADDEHVGEFQLLDHGVVQAVKVAVEVAGYINQGGVSFGEDLWVQGRRAAAIRSRASVSRERGQAAVRRRKPSPAEPKFVPGPR